MKRGTSSLQFPSRESIPEGFLGAAIFDHGARRVAHWSTGFWEVMGGDAAQQKEGPMQAFHERVEALTTYRERPAVSGNYPGLRIERISMSDGHSLLLLSQGAHDNERLATRLYNWHRACVSDIVATIAEDIQGTASSLVYNATYLASRTGASDVEETRDDIIATSRAAMGLLGRLSDMAKLQESAREVISLGELIEGARSSIYRRAKMLHVEIVEHIEPSTSVSTNVILAQQALVELLLNAVQSEGVTHVEVSSEVLVIHGGPLVRVRVEDNGVGVSELLTERIFQPFFSTYPDRSGMGLTVAREAARALGGELILDRRRGPTSFALLLSGVPRHEPEVER